MIHIILIREFYLSNFNQFLSTTNFLYIYKNQLKNFTIFINFIDLKFEI